MEMGNPPKIHSERKIETKTQIIIYLLNDLDTLSLLVKFLKLLFENGKYF